MSWPTVPMDALKAPGSYTFVGGPFGSELTTKDYVDEGVPVIRGNNLSKYGKFHDDDFVFVTDEKAVSLRSNSAYPGDLIFTQRGTLGQVGLIPKDATYDKYVVSQSQMKLTVDETKVNPLFVYYYFCLPTTIQRILGSVSTSGVPHINLSTLKAFKIPVPDKHVQNSIVELVRPYDDLIENNRRRIGLLEEAARLLYREWFVYFRFPGHEHVKITNGLPEGWEQKPFGEIAELHYGKALKEENRVSGPFPVYGSSGVVGSHQSRLVEGPAIVVGRKGNVGSVYWSSTDFWPIDTAYFIAKEQSDFWLYHALPSAGFQNTDAGVPGLNRDFAYSRKLILPPVRLRELYNGCVAPMFEQRNILESYNRKLAEARDLLLTRLMSGEIAV